MKRSLNHNIVISWMLLPTWHTELHWVFLTGTLTDLFLLVGIGSSLSGSPCWQTVLSQYGPMRKGLCCGTGLLSTHCLASYTHSMSSPSPWRWHLLKGLTSDPDGQEWMECSLLQGCRRVQIFIFPSCEKGKYIQRLEKCDFIIMKTNSGPEEVTDISSSKHIALFTNVNVLDTLFASGNSEVFPMLVYTVKFCFLLEKWSHS